MAAPGRETTRSFGAGLAGLLVIGVIVAFGLTASSGVPGRTTTEVRAAFTDVGASLRVGNDVRENSSRIGRVSRIAYENGRAVLTLELNGNVPVYADARAEIWDQSALAKKFVELNRGNPEAGPLGGRTIAVTRTVDSADLDQILDVLDPATRAKLTGTVRELGVGTAGHGRDLHDLIGNAPDLLGDLGTTSDTLSSPETDLPALLRQADLLAGSFAGHERRLAALIAEAGATADAIGTRQGEPLRDGIEQLPGTLRDAQAAFDALDRPLADARVALTTIQPGARALGQATPDLRGVLREGQPPLRLVPGVARKAQPAITDLTRTVADARPLVPALSRGLSNAAVPLTTLARYSRDVVVFFQRVESMVSTSVSPGVHGARVGVALEGPSAVTGGVVKDPLQGSDPYPEPGEADGQRTRSPLNVTSGGQP